VPSRQLVDGEPAGSDLQLRRLRLLSAKTLAGVLAALPLPCGVQHSPLQLDGADGVELRVDVVNQRRGVLVANVG